MTKPRNASFSFGPRFRQGFRALRSISLGLKTAVSNATRPIAPVRNFVLPAAGSGVIWHSKSENNAL